MRFTIGSRGLTRASAFNPTSKVAINNFNPNVRDAYGDWVPLQVRRCDGQAFGVAATLRDNTLERAKHCQVWTEEAHITVLSDLCELPEYLPQTVIDRWESGLAVRDAAERTTTQATCFVGARS